MNEDRKNRLQHLLADLYKAQETLEQIYDDDEAETGVAGADGLSNALEGLKETLDAIELVVQ